MWDGSGSIRAAPIFTSSRTTWGRERTLPPAPVRTQRTACRRDDSCFLSSMLSAGSSSRACLNLLAARARGEEGAFMRYDADRPPDAKTWMALDEGEQIDLVMAYHR